MDACRGNLSWLVYWTHSDRPSTSSNNGASTGTLAPGRAIDGFVLAGELGCPYKENAILPLRCPDPMRNVGAGDLARPLINRKLG